MPEGGKDTFNTTTDPDSTDTNISDDTSLSNILLNLSVDATPKDTNPAVLCERACGQILEPEDKIFAMRRSLRSRLSKAHVGDKCLLMAQAVPESDAEGKEAEGEEELMDVDTPSKILTTEDLTSGAAQRSSQPASQVESQRSPVESEVGNDFDYTVSFWLLYPSPEDM
jgi:hypothetical protein